MTPTAHWQQILEERLPIFGHRNWIVIADSAYPSHSAGSIETVAADCGMLDALTHALNRIDATAHLAATAHIDAELGFVNERDAPGVTAYRRDLKRQLGSLTVHERPHDESIVKLHDAASHFRVLIIKTNTAIPYSSVFLELGCGYWTPDGEGRLRAAMKAPPGRLTNR